MIKLILTSFIISSIAASVIGTSAWANRESLVESMKSAEERAEISFATNIELAKKAEISLYDLVQIKKSNEDLLKKLAEFKINKEITGKKIADSKVRDQFAMTREEMLKLIRNSNVDGLNIRWIFPEVVNIQLNEQINKSELDRKMRNHLQVKCQDCEFEIHIEKLPAIVAKQWDIDVNNIAIKNSILIPVIADAKNLWISARIKTFKKVPVATRWIPASQKIQSEDLELKLSEITNTKDGYLPIEQMIGSALIRSIPVGSVVGASDVKREATIKRGQSLKTQIESSDFEISISAVAEESGYVGDVIKVKSSDNQKMMMGKIKDNSSVVVL